MYLLDTDIVIYWLKGNTAIERRSLEAGIENLGISIISIAELYFGAFKSQQVLKNKRNVKIVASTIANVGFDKKSAEKFGEIKAMLSMNGVMLPDADIMIAAIAIANNRILVTNNLQHFKRIQDLQIENWLQ